MTDRFSPVVSPEVFELRPDYSAFSVTADGIDNTIAHPAIDRYVAAAVALGGVQPWTEEHLESWRAAFRAFGAKPQRTPCSADALMTRLRKEGRLPSINPVVDLYNAISVRYAIPIGGENIAAYVGCPRLTRARGTESFDTIKEGEPFTEAVPAGEVIWADERGVTCRRWNWRQGIRTRIDDKTHQIWFVLERLDPMPASAALEAVHSLMEALRKINPDVILFARKIDRHGSIDVG